MIYFRHPDIKIRKEGFGGVVMTRRGIYLLDKTEYAFLSEFHELDTETPDEMLSKLLEIEAVVSITKEEAETVRG
jgi:hypothetical protein